MPTTDRSAEASDEPAPLDNFVWHALTTTHRHLAEGRGPARRYQPEVAGFVAIEAPGDEAWAALAALLGPGETAVLSGHPAPAPPPTWTVLGGGFGYQMIVHALVEPGRADGEIVPLTVEDVPAMLALVELTKPGPFRVRTIELGNYYGVFEQGELIAMAGERLQTPQHTEISAVCTHPSARGRGLAANLTAHVAKGIVARGQTPVLHVAEHNVNAKRVYERLGFVVRRQLSFVAATPLS